MLGENYCIWVGELWNEQLILRLLNLFLLSQPGRLKKVQAIGWYLQEESMAQVSANLLDYEVTPLHVVYEETRKDAKVPTLFTV